MTMEHWLLPHKLSCLNIQWCCLCTSLQLILAMVFYVKLRIHDATRCTTGCTTGQLCKSFWIFIICNRPLFILLGHSRENSFCIFCVTRLSVNYSKRSSKHNDLKSIFTTTLPKDETAIWCRKTLKKENVLLTTCYKSNNKEYLIA